MYAYLFPFSAYLRLRSRSVFPSGTLLWNATSISVSTLQRAQATYDWEHHYAALRYYRSDYGHCNVPISRSYECHLPEYDITYRGNLGNWLHYQRQAKRKQKGLKLAPEREALLQQLVDEGRQSLSIHTVPCKLVGAIKACPASLRLELADQSLLFRAYSDVPF